METVRFIETFFMFVGIVIGMRIFFVPIRTDGGWRTYVSDFHRLILSASLDTLVFIIVVYLGLRLSGKL